MHSKSSIYSNKKIGNYRLYQSLSQYVRIYCIGTIYFQEVNSNIRKKYFFSGGSLKYVCKEKPLVNVRFVSFKKIIMLKLNPQLLTVKRIFEIFKHKLYSDKTKFVFILMIRFIQFPCLSSQMPSKQHLVLLSMIRISPE